MARRRKTDPYPKDRIGQMLFQSAVVLMADPNTIPAVEHGKPGYVMELILGYIKKLGKSYADVTYYDDEGADFTIRLKDPSKRLIVVDTDKLDGRDPGNEKVMMAAAMGRDYK